MKNLYNYIWFCLICFFVPASTTAQYIKTTYKHSEQKIRWLTLKEAQTLVKKKKKKIIIDLYTDNCGWCKVMEKNTFSNSDVIAYVNNNFYPIKLDAETKEDLIFNNKIYEFIPTTKGGYNKLALELTGGRLSYPSVIFLDEKLNVIQPIQGFQDAKTFLMILKYFGEDKHKTMPWSIYEKEYK